ncbi:chemotaxis protein CheW [Salinimonas sediminis]|uniref:Chemotaxis protein CheW n=1 Tax=Salinimonas sediminis TaxID=2303538 RepID=A0A346NJQ7_9ALTE|nr:chemotaxis protein CheW [Salinimonas sediminis]AXR05764.1 chemotaxis protein CheW [Salinimonas sediminis]
MNNKQTPFANEDVVEAYLDGLLSEPQNPADITANTARLLEEATRQLQTSHEVDTPIAPPLPRDEAVTADSLEALPQLSGEAALLEQFDQVLEPVPAAPATRLQDQLDNKFQALFFEVAGLTLAVPLITLGGIHRLEKTGPLFGKPPWFKGVMLHRKQKLNVVDTAIWVMPEKYDQNLAEKLHYQYLIMLGDSPWGLASDKLVNTVTLTKDQVKWREVTGKRPWLAGMVKDKMCALVNVYQLISMLNQGLGSQG